MKKIFLLILGFIISVSSVSAKNLRVEAMSDLSTANPPKTWKVKIVDGFIAQDGFVVYAGSVLEGRIESISEPKRLKRNAAFVFVPTKYYDAGDNTCRTVTEKIEGKYRCTYNDCYSNTKNLTHVYCWGKRYVSYL